MPVKRNYPNFDVSGLNKWGVPNYKSVMTVKGKPPKIYGSTGGNLKPGYQQTLNWYSKKTPQNTPDKIHTQKLLSQFCLAPAKALTPKKSPNYRPRTGQARPKTAKSSNSNWSYWKLTKRREVPETRKVDGIKIQGRSFEGGRPESETWKSISSTPRSVKSFTGPRRGLGTPRRSVEETEKSLAESLRIERAKSAVIRKQSLKSHKSSGKAQEPVKPEERSGTGYTVRDSSNKEVGIGITIEYKGGLRPKTAMAALGNKFMDPYSTSYGLNYADQPTENQSTEAVRPKTSRGLRPSYELEGAIGTTTVQDDYCMKSAKREVPIRSGTSSGARSNNPHPDQMFMTWKYPRNKTSKEACGAPASNRNYRPLTSDVLGQIIRDNMRSTYHEDYMGIPQGYEMKGAIDAPPDWVSQVPKPLDTTTRRTYTSPVSQSDCLKVGTTRYDCNQNYVKPAVGIVPTVSKRQLVTQKNIEETTQYKDEYFNRGVNPKLNKLMNQRKDRDWHSIYLKATSLSLDAEAKKEVEAV